MVVSSTRQWTDLNTDYVPQEAELGPHSATNFGQVGIATRYSDDITQGWHNREYSWQGSVSVQHELRPGLALNLGYFRTWYGNFNATDNLAVTPDDYDPYCLTAPPDDRLPNAGDQVCGFYDLRPDKFGAVNNLVRPASEFGKQSEVFNGGDVTVNWRFGRGGILAGGVSLGQTVTDLCFVVDSPQQLYQCRNAPPLAAGAQLKLSGVYTLPWEIRASATYQNIASIPLTASYVASNAQIRPTLERDLGACRPGLVCTATTLVELMENNSVYREGRNNQINMRFTRVFRIGLFRIEPQVDVFNLLNSNQVLVMNTRYGTTWQNVTGFLAPRVFKFGAQVNF